MMFSNTLDRTLALYVDKPYHCFGGGCCTLLLLTALSVLTGSMNMTLDQESAWSVHSGSFTQSMEGYKQARREHGDSGRRLQDSNDDDDGPKNLILMYKAGSGNDVFTATILQDICRFETRLLQHGVCSRRGTNCPSFSPVKTFYGNFSQAAADGCPLLSSASIEATRASIAREVKLQGTSSSYAGLLTPGFLQSNRTLHTRSSFDLLGSDKAATEEAVLKALFKHFDPPRSYGFLRSAFEGEEDQMLPFGGVRVRIYFQLEEFMRMLPADFSLAVCSMLFVYATLYLHLGSFFLASFGMWQIVASLPIAGLFYRQLFMVDYFEFLHVLVVYLVLGVGADDIFVLLDSWRHLKAEAGIRPGKAGGERDAMLHTLKETWVRTAGAIFNTSFTTGVAFMSMSVSGVMPMKTCGWFAAISVIFNYVFTIAFTPSLLMVHHLHFAGKSCCQACRRKTGSSVAPEMSEETQAPKEEHGCFARSIERFLKEAYLPMMQWSRGGLKPVPIAFVVIMAAVGIQGTYFASRLTPPSKPEQWFPGHHMWPGLSEFMSATFYSPDHDRYEESWLVWGLGGLNFDDFNEYKPDDNPAAVVYDTSFDLSTREAQQAFLNTCSGLRNLACNEAGCRGGNKYLLQVGEQQAISCVLDDFRRWLNATQNWDETQDLPTGSNFLALLKQFRDQADPNVYGDDLGDFLSVNYGELLGFSGSELRYAAIKGRTTMLKQEPYGSGVEVRSLVHDFVQQQLPSMPPSMQSLEVASDGFASFDLGQELVSGLFSGMAIAGPLVFVVLLLSTRNIILAFYALISVAAIVVSVLGFCKSAMDYDLGVGEAIAGIIVIGYSVDYVVHFAHTYCEGARNGLHSREERATFTIHNMGSTVFAGALTTAGSGVFMFFCFLTFFTKMALLICMTIFFSFLFSLCFFMGLCFLVGPEGDCGSLGWVCSRQNTSPVVKVPPHETAP